MVLQTILEGLGLGALLALVCAVGICKGAVGMVHLYRDLQHTRKSSAILYFSKPFAFVIRRALLKC